MNLVQEIDVTKLYEVNGGLCSVLHTYECYCATSDDKKDRKAVYEARLEYNEKLVELAQSEEFSAEDFAVVIQPFLKGLGALLSATQPGRHRHSEGLKRGPGP